MRLAKDLLRRFSEPPSFTAEQLRLVKITGRARPSVVLTCDTCPQEWRGRALAISKACWHAVLNTWPGRAPHVISGTWTHTFTLTGRRQP